MHAHSTPLPRRHYQLLGLIVVVAIALRFWHLGTKPLWLDEVIGAIFTVGKGLDDIPLNTLFPLTELAQLFTLESGQSCHQIAQRVATESVHPPLFFCLQYRWLGWWLPLLSGPLWVWVLRSLPALFGIAGVLGIYGVGRMAFGPRIGLTAAGLMAVSPFAVYLSQEARHYTLPMLWTILALMGLLHIQNAMAEGRPLSRMVLVGWISVNSLGLYTHYFFILDFVAQIMALGSWMLWRTVSPIHNPIQSMRRYMGQLVLSTTVIIVSYAPWIPTLLHHINRPETDWLKPYKPDWSDRVAPLYQTIMGWILMIISFPVESQPLAIAIPSVILTIGLGVWIGWHVIQGLRCHWQTGVGSGGVSKWERGSVGAWERGRDGMFLFLMLFVSLLIQVLAIVYILDKDITAIPRYNFISYPILLILIALGLAHTSVGSDLGSGSKRLGFLSSTQPTTSLSPLTSSTPDFRLPPPLFSPLSLTLITGLLSAILAIHGIVFQKGYYPHRVAQDMTQFSEQPLLVAVSYESLQEVALGLSFALEIEKRYPTTDHIPPAHFIFVDRTNGYKAAWQQLKTTPHSLPLPLNMWAIASPGMKTKDYPATLKIRQPDRNAKTTCPIDPGHFHRIGFPYQLFRCAATRK